MNALIAFWLFFGVRLVMPMPPVNDTASMNRSGKRHRSNQSGTGDEQLKGSNSVPQFVLDLFHLTADKNGLPREGAPDLGKTIDCLYAKDSSHEGTDGKSFIYDFNTSLARNLVTVNCVELRVFKTKSKRSSKKLFYKTDIRLVSKNYQFSTSVMVSSTGYGWQSFDITDTARKFILNNEPEITAYISIRSNGDSIPTFRFLTESNIATRSLLIIYSKTITDISNFEGTKYKQLLPIDISVKEENRNRMRRSENSANTLCSLRSMTMRFKHHKELHNVMLPLKTNIHRCEGSCSIPLGLTKDVLDTYHAVFQRFVLRHRMKKDKKLRLIKPCCSPKTFRDLHVIVNMDDSANILILPNAIVTSCMCA